MILLKLKKQKFVIQSFGERKKKSLNSLVTDEITNTARVIAPFKNQDSTKLMSSNVSRVFAFRG